jgi:Xaa-Pro dipeptidase
MSDSVYDGIYIRRQSRLAAAMEAAGFAAVVINAGPTLFYLTGLHFHLSERPVVGIFTAQGPVTMVLPELEGGKLAGLPYPVRSYPYGDDPEGWERAFRDAAEAARISGVRLGVEPRRLRLLELRYLESAAPGAEFQSAESLIAGLRMRKDPEEITAMRQAVTIAERSLLDTLPLVRSGMSARELAREITAQLLQHGCDPELPFQPIVASGPDSANPHASLSDRPLTEGDLLILDWGANYGGYFSDLTRTFVIGHADPELEKIAVVVSQANEAGRAAVRPGASASAVDRAARQVIEHAGYGGYFIHRTGHGLGLEVHEEPYIFAGNPMILEPGMTFTIEPGIYLPGRGGVRVEDNVVVTDEGVETLSALDRTLLRI